MRSLIKYRTGMFYVVCCQKGKRIWISLRTRERVVENFLSIAFRDRVYESRFLYHICIVIEGVEGSHAVATVVISYSISQEKLVLPKEYVQSSQYDQASNRPEIEKRVGSEFFARHRNLFVILPFGFPQRYKNDDDTQNQKHDGDSVEKWHVRKSVFEEG